MAVSRVVLFEAIRRDRRVDPQVSVRVLMRRHRVSFRTVTQALAVSSPAPRRPPSCARVSSLEPLADWIDEILRADLSAPRKQRHTVARILQRLADERGFGEVAYRTLCTFVARRRVLVEAQARSSGSGATVPQLHAPGEEAEVDFAEAFVEVAGVQVKCYLFTLRLSYSRKAVHRVYATQSQEAFLQGHVDAFAALGGVPTRHIRYDNLKPAVNQVCFGRSRVESTRWVAFRSHYQFDPFYCIPGQEGAHEKGGVEQEGGRFRRAHLVPVLSVGDLGELNERLAGIDADEDARHVHGSATSIGFDFAVEAPLLRRLPGEDFEPGLTLTPKVRGDSRVVVRQCYYSVPVRLIGRRVEVLLRANEVLVREKGQVVARHRRLGRRYDFHDDLDHYLEVLLAKPGALAGSTALAAARAEGAFTALHEAFWSRARAARGDAEGTRALIDVLLLHRRMSHEEVLAGLAEALDAGSVSVDLVAIAARRAVADGRPPQDEREDLGPLAHGPEDLAPAPDAARVIDLRPARTAHEQRPLPSVAAYDQLLPRRLRGTR